MKVEGKVKVKAIGGLGGTFWKYILGETFWAHILEADSGGTQETNSGSHISKIWMDIRPL